MKIAHIFASIEPTGGDRISFHHIDGLRKLGHTVDVYYSGIFENYWAGREFNNPSMKKIMFKYDPVKMEHGEYNNGTFDKYDMIISNGLFGSYYVSFLNHPLKIWFCQNLDKYVFSHGTEQDKNTIDNLYKKHKNYMSYSPHLLNLIEYYYGNKNRVLCTNGITYKEFEPFQKKLLLKSNKICFMSAYNGVLKRGKFANLVFKELNKRGYVTVEINAHRKCLKYAQEFHQNPYFDEKCRIMAACDVMIHTSSFETWSLVTMESMALGLPVLGYDSKGVSLFAKHNQDIVFVDKFNVDLFCNEIDALVSDKDRYEKIQTNGINTASKYDWDDVILEIEDSYLSWLD